MGRKGWSERKKTRQPAAASARPPCSQARTSASLRVFGHEADNAAISECGILNFSGPPLFRSTCECGCSRLSPVCDVVHLCRCSVAISIGAAFRAYQEHRGDIFLAGCSPLCRSRSPENTENDRHSSPYQFQGDPVSVLWTTRTPTAQRCSTTTSSEERWEMQNLSGGCTAVNS